MLYRQDGFIGMLLVSMVSLGIFMILTSVHIYTLKQAKYNNQIKEALIMQTEMENFSIRIMDAYNRGKVDCPSAIPCCNNYGFNIRTACNREPSISTNPDMDFECLISSSKRKYCLVKIEGGGGQAAYLKV